MTDEEFEIANKRRGELIAKKHSGFTKEESSRRFDLDPQWAEEYERRIQANLTAEEWQEYHDLQKATGDYLNDKYPLPTEQDIRRAVD